MGNSWTAVTPELAEETDTSLWLEEAANLRWHPLSTQEWLQLGKLAQDLPPYSTVYYWHYKQSQASGDWAADEHFTWTSVDRGSWRRFIPRWWGKSGLNSATLQTREGGTRKTWICPAVARWVIERSNAWMERCKVWLRTLSELYLMQRLRSISALSGSCWRSQSLPEISNGFYTAAISFFSSSFWAKGVS